MLDNEQKRLQRFQNQAAQAAERSSISFLHRSSYTRKCTSSAREPALSPGYTGFGWIREEKALKVEMKM